MTRWLTLSAHIFLSNFRTTNKQHSRYLIQLNLALALSLAASFHAVPPRITRDAFVFDNFNARWQFSVLCSFLFFMLMILRVWMHVFVFFILYTLVPHFSTCPGFYFFRGEILLLIESPQDTNKYIFAGGIWKQVCTRLVKHGRGDPAALASSRMNTNNGFIDVCRSQGYEKPSIPHRVSFALRTCSSFQHPLFLSQFLDFSLSLALFIVITFLLTCSSSSS